MLRQISGNQRMKAIHNHRRHQPNRSEVAPNIRKSKNESNSQLSQNSLLRRAKLRQISGNQRMKAIHNLTKGRYSAPLVAPNIRKSKNESNSQLKSFCSERITVAPNIRKSKNESNSQQHRFCTGRTPGCAKYQEIKE